MSGRNKGFDPLASLFAAPDPARGVPLPDEAEEPLSDPGRKLELNDPMVKRPAPPPETPLMPSGSRPRGTLPPTEDEDAAQGKAALARRLALAAIQSAGAPSAALPPPDDSEEISREELARQLAARAIASAAPAAPAPPGAGDKQALARRLAAEALARANAAPDAAQDQPSAQTPPPEAGEDKVALARRLAAQAQARALAIETPTQAPSTGPSAVEKADLARRLAAAAVERAGADAERDAERKAAAKPSRANARRSRVASISDRARKPVSALEAAKVAARDEEERHAQDLRKQEDQLRDVVQDLVPEWLPGIGTVYVANAIAVQQRDLLRVLWKSHRSKFLAEGELERAVGAAAVLAALDQSPDGTLVAAHAVTDASDYLVWLDLDKRSLVAAFSDARAYFAGQP